MSFRIKVGKQLDSEDFHHAKLIEQMMVSEAWKLLDAYIDAEEEDILTHGMNKRLENTAKEQWAYLRGFRHARNIAKNLVERANIARENEIDEENQKNEIFENGLPK